MVTPDAPVKAVKIAQESSVTMARPPGSQPNKERDKSTIRFGALLSANKYPAKVKRGIASRTG